MSSYNNISKLRYDGNTDTPVDLMEYILYTDDRAKKKFIVLKLKNNINQPLFSFQALIKEYDSEHKLIGKTVINHDVNNVLANDYFVPESRLEIDYNTQTIEYSLMDATFESVIYNNGNFIPRDYTLDNLRSDFRATKKEEDKKKEEVKQKKLDKKHKSSVKDITKSNVTVLPRVFRVLFTILILGYFISTFFIFNITGGYMTDNKFSYKKLSDNTVEIIDYVGDDERLVIPSKINDYFITRIGKEAFKDSKIKEIVFSASIEIGEYAFENSSLSVINNPDFISKMERGAFMNSNLLTFFYYGNTVYKDTFKGCNKLITLYAPSAELKSGCLTGTSSLSYMTAFSTKCSYFYELFGNKKSDIPKTLYKHNVSLKSYDTQPYFFDGLM